MMKKFNFIRDGETKLPPGFRFEPTDEEIVFQYLAPKIFSFPLPAFVIPEIDPFHLPKLSGDLNQERYLFAHRELMNARNVNRIIGGGGGSVGFWKVTGRDKRIVSSKTMPIFGIRRTLVFYKGKHLSAVRTSCCMHVYCIAISLKNKSHSGGMIQIGKWVLCHVFSKKRSVEGDDCDRFPTSVELRDADSCSSDSDSGSCSGSSVLSEVSSSSV